MSDTIKYGVIGAGVMGQEHIQNINIIENAEVVAVCDTNERSRKQTKSLVKESICWCKESTRESVSC